VAAFLLLLLLLLLVTNAAQPLQFLVTPKTWTHGQQWTFPELLDDDVHPPLWQKASSSSSSDGFFS
jgi:hypothetical protein